MKRLGYIILAVAIGILLLISLNNTSSTYKSSMLSEYPSNINTVEFIKLYTMLGHKQEDLRLNNTVETVYYIAGQHKLREHVSYNYYINDIKGRLIAVFYKDKLFRIIFEPSVKTILHLDYATFSCKRVGIELECVENNNSGHRILVNDNMYLIQERWEDERLSDQLLEDLLYEGIIID